MSVSHPNSPSLINCTVIQLYTQSSFLKFTMATQGSFGILSLLSMSVTLRKVLTTVMVDRAFKEYIIVSYAVQFVQCLALSILQIIFFYIHLFRHYCDAFITARLCYTLRMVTAVNSILPLLNVALTIFRYFVLRNSTSSWRECIWLSRSLQLIAMILGVAFQFYKISLVNMDGYVVYCVSNFKGINTALSVQNAYTSCCEVFSIVFGMYLFRSYKQSVRTFNISCSLQRRQAIQTFSLFIPYSLLQLIAFLSLAGLSTLYRIVFNDLAEPNYSAGNGLLYIPMYLSTFAPWMIYGIISREEEKRKKSSIDLRAQDNIGADLYFQQIKDQWDEVEKIKASPKLQRMFSYSRILPAAK